MGRRLEVQASQRARSRRERRIVLHEGAIDARLCKGLRIEGFTEPATIVAYSRRTDMDHALEDRVWQEFRLHTSARQQLQQASAFGPGYSMNRYTRNARTSLNRDGFGKVAWLVDVGSLGDGDEIGQQLHRNRGKDRHGNLVGIRQANDVIGPIAGKLDSLVV